MAGGDDQTGAQPARSPGAARAGADRAQSGRRFVFVLLPRFTMISFAAAIEPLRIANRALGRAQYRWLLAGPSGETATCSNGAELRLDCGLDDTFGRGDVVVVCGGLDIEAATGRTLVNWLRRVARQGAEMGALCTGAHALARAGLLDGRRATIHWENHDSFLEEFPDVGLSRNVFEIDGTRLTAAGGTAPIDLMLALISADLGPEVASLVADQMIHTAIRSGQDSQRLSIPTRIGVRHPRLGNVIEIMEAHVEDPVSPATLAARVGMSTRQLERLFRRYLGRSPKRYYMELRLQKARNLLMQTNMSVINVALACGFASPSHFSKCYRAVYDTTPYRERGTRAPDAGGAQDGA